MFGRKTIGLEELLWCFRHSKGLFLLGAGASTGIVPFSQSLMAAPAVDFHDGFTSLSVSPTEKDIAAQRSAAAGLTKLLERRRQPGFRRGHGQGGARSDARRLRQLPHGSRHWQGAA